MDDDLKRLEIEKSITKLQSPSKVEKKALKKEENIPTLKKNTKLKLRGEDAEEIIIIGEYFLLLHILFIYINYIVLS